MQCKNGGWASFDKDNTKMIPAFPFADHNALLDPPDGRYHGRILEMLPVTASRREDPRVREGDSICAIASRSRTGGGSWFGRRGVNIYMAVPGVAAD